jgi:hypothetical protein
MQYLLTCLILSEFLPRILGPKLMSEFELNPSELYNENVYDHTCKADVYNEFAVAAFRSVTIG